MEGHGRSVDAVGRPLPSHKLCTQQLAGFLVPNEVRVNGRCTGMVVSSGSGFDGDACRLGTVSVRLCLKNLHDAPFVVWAVRADSLTGAYTMMCIG